MSFQRKYSFKKHYQITPFIKQLNLSKINKKINGAKKG